MVQIQVLCGKNKGDLGRQKLYLPLTLHTLQACLQSSSRDVYRSGVLTPANSILSFILPALAETDDLRRFSLLPVKTCAQWDRLSLSLAKKARWQKASRVSAGTRRSSGDLYRHLTSSWRSQAAAFRSSPHLQARLPRRQGASSWVGCGTGQRCTGFPGVGQRRDDSQGMVRSRGRRQDRNTALCTHNNQLCLPSNDKQVFTEELVLFSGLLWWSGIDSRNCIQSVVCSYAQLASRRCPKS